ncbi:MAG: tyrosine-type recombinase/integrase [Planctomycetota bacterium]
MKRFGRPKRISRRGTQTSAYYCRVHDVETGQDSLISTRCDNRKAAMEWWQTRQYELAIGPERTQQQQKAGTRTLGDLYQAWLTAKSAIACGHHIVDLKARGDRFWLRHFGEKRPLIEITPDDVRLYLAKRAAGRMLNANTENAQIRAAEKAKLHPRARKPKKIVPKKLSAASLNADLRALRSLFNFAVREGWLERSPAAPVEPHAGEVRQKTFSLTEIEEERLLRACREELIVSVKGKRNAGGRAGGRKTRKKISFDQPIGTPIYLQPLVAVALYSGLRRGTLLSLRWCDADLEQRRWRIPPEIMKTSIGYDAPMAPRVAEALKQFRQELAALCKANKTPVAERLGSKCRVFGLEPNSSVKRSFQRAVRRSNLGRRFSFHDCRRCFLQKLRAANVPLDVAMQLTGHSSIQTVVAHYRQVPIAEQERAVAALEPVSASVGNVAAKSVG